MHIGEYHHSGVFRDDYMNRGVGGNPGRQDRGFPFILNVVQPGLGQAQLVVLNSILYTTNPSPKHIGLNEKTKGRKSRPSVPNIPFIYLHHLVCICRIRGLLGILSLVMQAKDHG